MLGLTDFLSSAGGATTTAAGLNFLGNLLSGKASAEQAQQSQALSNAQNEANLEAERNKIAVGITDPTKLQNWRQKQATVAAIMPGLRNASVKAPAGMEAYMPSVSGGFSIPEGGFGSDTLAFYSPESRAAAEGTFWSAASPYVDAPDLTQVGYGSAGASATAQAQAARQKALAQQQQSAAARAALAGGSGSSGSGTGSALAGAAAGALTNAAMNGAGGDVGKLLSSLWSKITGGGTGTLTQNNPTTSTGLSTPTISQGQLVDNNYGYLNYGSDWGETGSPFDIASANTDFAAPSSEPSTTPEDLNLLYMTPEELAYYYGY